MATSSHYDCVVVGSGQGGTPLASAFAKAGRRTALVESTHVGGCCVNDGCTPTKTLVASGRVAYLARRAADYGVHAPGAVDGQIAVDMAKVRQRKREIVTQFRGGGEARTKAAGVDLLMGQGSFQDAKTMLVKLQDGSERTISATSFFISTGERPAKAALKGLADVDPTRILDSTSIQELGVLPSHLICLGGGVVGLEFSQLFRRLGAAVTIIQRSPQLLPREDPEIAACLLEILEEDGIKVHLNASAVAVTQSTLNPIELTVRHKDGAEEAVAGSHLLLAAGRTPNTDMLNLASAGVETSKRGYVVVNERLETNVTGIYAMGDVKGPPAFTHISYDDFRILRGNILEQTSPPLTYTNRMVPSVTYTDPQLGHIGLHEQEARAKFPERQIQTAKMPMSYVARALETDETRGMMKAVVDGQSGEILGFTCLGIEGGEVMTVVQTAMMGGVRWETLRDAVWAHPTLAESLNNLWGFLE
ncbi:MAG: hypothetical protein M1838_002544 [Thelocarpon superellum]|nr:MAG: hypothetical protein M1838_002544 [Thelocarpon superellum]